LWFGGGVEIHHDGDLLVRSGMGSSFAFTVGLLNALDCYLSLMRERWYSESMQTIST
jgi:galactokinase/mevalonate kinase-like predicted kinase